MRKHAQANQVDVLISREEHLHADMVHMKILDDGVGFKMAGSKRNFGLQTMRERAESVNGNLVIRSVSDSGTCIECWLPCLQPERLQRQSVVIR